MWDKRGCLESRRRKRKKAKQEKTNIENANSGTDSSSTETPFVQRTYSQSSSNRWLSTIIVVEFIKMPQKRMGTFSTLREYFLYASHLITLIFAVLLFLQRDLPVTTIRNGFLLLSFVLVILCRVRRRVFPTDWSSERKQLQLQRYKCAKFVVSAGRRCCT